MEKLIELLNEYEKSTGIVFNIWTKEGTLHYYDNYKDENIYDNVKLLIISKQYGFIKWLVDNDKIDREKFGNSETKSSKYSDFELSYDTPREDYTNILLMELAIQDEPIQFLIGILR